LNKFRCLFLCLCVQKKHERGKIGADGKKVQLRRQKRVSELNGSELGQAASILASVAADTASTMGVPAR
jgi:hypothetical protein